VHPALEIVQISQMGDKPLHKRLTSTHIWFSWVLSDQDQCRQIELFIFLCHASSAWVENYARMTACDLQSFRART